MSTVERITARDCPECRAVGSIVLGICGVCFAEYREGDRRRLTSSVSWDLDLDEPIPEGRRPLGW